MKQQFLCLSAADIHGNITQYEKIKKLVADKGISFVFLCGDILPKDGGTWTPENKVRTIKMQADFINKYFLHYLTELGQIAKVYAIFGNDDFISNYHLVSEARIADVTFLNNEVAKLPIPGRDLYVAGYPNIGLTPFLHKDWEKWDTAPGDIPHKLFRSDGYTSVDNTHVAIDRAEDASTILGDLERLANLSDPRKTVYIFHEAPYNTPLDMIAPDNKFIKDGGVHVGSRAIRNFVETKQPLLTMHGHIHETFAESGDFKWETRQSISVTAANDFSGNTVSYVLFSLPALSRIVRLTA